MIQLELFNLEPYTDTLPPEPGIDDEDPTTWYPNPEDNDEEGE